MYNSLFKLDTAKVYRLGGETDSAIQWRKRTACDVGERPEELKLSLKKPSIFCECRLL